MNPVLLLTRNCLELTKRCVESVRNQDIPVSIHIYDNESTDGTKEWIREQSDIIDQSSGVDLHVTAGWNFALDILFDEGWNADHVLVIGNDTMLPPWFYSTLLSYEGPLVTGVAVDTWPIPEPGRMPLAPHPDFSAYLIRRGCWTAVGPFDEEMVCYVQDCDMHVRAHQSGIPLMKANVPFYHVNSQTMKRASSTDRQWIHERANLDREVFKRKWGCLPGTPEYNNLFKEAHAQTSAQ